MAGYKKKRKLFGNKKNNPEKTHYRTGKTPKPGKPYTISQRDLDVHSSFIQDNEDYRTMKEQEKNQKEGVGPKPMHEGPIDTVFYMSPDSPNKFLGTLGVMKGGGALIKGIKNRDEFGGGLKGALKGTGDALTSGGLVGKIKDGINKRNEEINTKLDTIIAAVGGSEEPGADTMSTSPGAAPLGMASPAKFKEFMKTTQQAPISNNTGGKKSTFDPVMADRMMAVSDPETNTKDLLFMLGGNIPATSKEYFKKDRPAKNKKKAVTKMTGPGDKGVSVTDEGIKAGNVKIKPYGETKGTDPAGYTKNKGGFKVNLANLPVNLKVGFDQKSTGYKSSITPSFQIGGKIKIKGKKQEEPKHT